MDPYLFLSLFGLTTLVGNGIVQGQMGHMQQMGLSNQRRNFPSRTGRLLGSGNGNGQAVSNPNVMTFSHSMNSNGMGSGVMDNQGPQGTGAGNGMSGHNQDMTGPGNVQGTTVHDPGMSGQNNGMSGHGQGMSAQNNNGMGGQGNNGMSGPGNNGMGGQGNNGMGGQGQGIGGQGMNSMGNGMGGGGMGFGMMGGGIDPSAFMGGTGNNWMQMRMAMNSDMPHMFMGTRNYMQHRACEKTPSIANQLCNPATPNACQAASSMLSASMPMGMMGMMGMGGGRRQQQRQQQRNMLVCSRMNEHGHAKCCAKTMAYARYLDTMFK
ncbi:uncharacterized protein LOC143080341 [Mytilus galloprovincialis]|uniref:uncharacterized protein LOC143080341 n=1 Tax=Mytilus galloprovincialis TaxID=29158 RepID=UPI003F7C227D